MFYMGINFAFDAQDGPILKKYRITQKKKSDERSFQIIRVPIYYVLYFVYTNISNISAFNQSKYLSYDSINVILLI